MTLVSVIEEHKDPLEEIPMAKCVLQVPYHPVQEISCHCFLFGEEFVTVNSLGSVLSSSAPRVPHKGSAISKLIRTHKSRGLFTNIIDDAHSFRISAVHCGKQTIQVEDVIEACVVTEQKFSEFEEF